MENNKYYIPTVEELHVGYECEIKNSADARHRFNKVIIDKEFLPIFLRVTSESIRTKYLDKEDIESLRWTPTYSLIEIMGLGKKYVKNIQIDSVSTQVTLLHYSDEDHTINIYVKLEDRTYVNNEGDRLFNGKCKSINELRKIMQWIRIPLEVETTK